MKGPLHMDFVTFMLNTLQISFIETLYLVGVFIAIGLVLGLLEKQSNYLLVRSFGRRGILLTAWIGTPIHELGHLIQCIIWRHKVTKVKFLQLNNPDGILGFVEHSYNRASIYQQIGNFFIGLGPIFSGIGALVLCMYLLVPDSFTTFQSQIGQPTTLQNIDMNLFKTVGDAVIALSKSLFTVDNLSTPTFWVFLVLAICISSHIALSKADIQNSAHGLVMMFLLLVLINVFTGLFDVNSSQLMQYLRIYNAYIIAFSSIAIFCSLMTFVFSLLLFKLKGR
jgi:hypothetical protein